MPTEYHKKLLLHAVFSLTLLKLLTPGADKQDLNLDASHLIKEHNQSALKALCGEAHSEYVRVCSMPSESEDFGNSRKCTRVLVFRLNNTVIKVFIDKHQISLPDAMIYYRMLTDSGIPVYREEISKSLYVFYEGSFVFLEFSISFSAEWDGIHFKGRAYFLALSIELLCKESESSFYLIDHCFYCSAICSEMETINRINISLINDHDLFKADHDYLVPDYENVMFFEQTQIYKRLADATDFPSTPLSCKLHVVADHLFYKFVGAESVIQTINSMFSVINDVDALFRSTDFDGDQQGDDIGFIVGKVTVLLDEHDPKYNLSQLYQTAEEYLKQFSIYNFSDVCLGVGFTYREFNGLSGSAYPAFSDRSIPGGLCQKRMRVNFDMLSTNTVIMTYLNFGRRLEKIQAVLMLAHELGHSFGAGHDVSQECYYNGNNGYFLMSPVLNSGKFPNNPKFSVCSIRSMLPVIRKKGSCLIRNDPTPQCGNTVPETGEECDCGTSNICHVIDPCCTPADVVGDIDKPCTVRRSKGKLCSPKVNPCCTDSCSYVSQSANWTCNQFNACSYQSTCDGQSGHCPYSDPLPDGVLCNNGLQVCRRGMCSQSLCEYHNLSSCICSEISNQCKLCCRHPQTLICQPVNYYRILNNNRPIHQEPGSQCYNYGFCDLSLNCRSTADIIISRSTVIGFRNSREFKIHVKKYWLYYIFMAFCVVFTVIVILLPYHIDDKVYLRAVRYGKMSAVLSAGEHQTKIYRKTLMDINDYYTSTIQRLHRICEPRDYFETVERLKCFFPEVHISYLSHITDLGVSEHNAVKVLLMQGFKLKTLTKPKSQRQDQF